jgi:hypothetical protein
MLRRMTILGACLLIVGIVSGCQPEGAASPVKSRQEQVDQPGDSTIEPDELRMTHWSFSADSGLRVFLGSSLVTTSEDAHVLKAVDQTGSLLWSSRLPGMVFDLVQRSDQSEGLALTSGGTFWVDLRSGEIIGAGPFDQAVVGEFIWHGDWILVGLPTFQPPVNAKSPGKSSEQTSWTLYHAQRKAHTWQNIGQLTENGFVYAGMSGDGRVALVGDKNERSVQVYQEGQAIRAIEPRGIDSRFALTMSGRYVAERYRDGLMIHSVDGRVVAEVRHPDDGFHLWGDRFILSSADEFSVYSFEGQELFHHVGTLARQQFNINYVVAGEGRKSVLINATGRIVASIPRAIDTLSMTSDGKWVYSISAGGLDAYSVPS